VVSSGQFVGLGLACLVVIIVPGPSVLFVVGRALSYGKRTALLSVVGNSVGTYLAAVCVSVGLGPFLQRSDVLFETIKLLGAAYLVWLGVQALRHSGHRPDAEDSVEPVRSWWRVVRTGVFVGVTNPKTFVIFGAILPQFVDRSAGSVPAQMLVLAVLPAVIGLCTDTVWGLVAGQARGWLSRTPGRMAAMGRIGGVSMIGLGLTVALTGRHD
jgi:threonine/homoserine/homoserine lactone efflux protein